MRQGGIEAATLDGNAHPESPRQAWNQLMGPTGQMPHPPARGGGSTGGPRSMCHQQACRAMASSSKAQPARLNQIDLVKYPHDEASGIRLQRLLHRPKSIGVTRGFNEQYPARIKPQLSKAGPMKQAKFMGERLGPAPDDGSRATPAAHCQPQGKTNGQCPACGSTRAVQ